MAFILALDEGTTSARALVFDHSGGVRAIAQREFRQLFPQPGWVEHDPEEIWTAQLAVAHEALSSAGITARDLAAIGITNQRETVVAWDRESGKPLANAIVWQDRRTAPICEDLVRAGHEPMIAGRTGLVVDAYFSGTKLKWLLDHVPDVRAAAGAGRLAVGTIDSWLVWKLTGGVVHITDETNASRTLLYNIRSGAWDPDLLALFGVPRAALPDVRPSSHVVAETAPGLFGSAVPIAGIAGDQQAALVGQACTGPGMVKNTYGTGCFMLMHTGGAALQSRNRLITTAACSLDGKRSYALEGSVFIAGAVVQWLRDGLGIIRDAADVERLAASVDGNDGVYFVPAFTGLGSPHWDPYARGTIVGITRGTGTGHIARAALESIAYQSADLVHAMEQDAGCKLAELRVDGGATRNDLLMQFQADLLGVPVVRPRVTETTALGAAYLAGLATGFWRDARDLADHWRVDRVFEPVLARDRAEVLMVSWRRAVERAKGWAGH
jgi:glycerol kinase